MHTTALPQTHPPPSDAFIIRCGARRQRGHMQPAAITPVLRAHAALSLARRIITSRQSSRTTTCPLCTTIAAQYGVHTDNIVEIPFLPSLCPACQPALSAAAAATKCLSNLGGVEDSNTDAGSLDSTCRASCCCIQHSRSICKPRECGEARTRTHAAGAALTLLQSHHRCGDAETGGPMPVSQSQQRAMSNGITLWKSRSIVLRVDSRASRSFTSLLHEIHLLTRCLYFAPSCFIFNSSHPVWQVYEADLSLPVICQVTFTSTSPLDGAVIPISLLSSDP